MEDDKARDATFSKPEITEGLFLIIARLSNSFTIAPGL